MANSVRTWLAMAVLAGATGAAAQPPSGAGAGSCVLHAVVAGPVALDDERLFFRGQPDLRRSYVAAFKGRPCPGLDRFASVTIETTPRGYCEGDKVRVIRLPTTIPGPVCVIDHLQPIDGTTVDQRRHASSRARR